MPQSLEHDGEDHKVLALEKTDSVQGLDAFMANLEGYIQLYAMRVPRKPRDNIIVANVLTTFLTKIGGACMFDIYLGPENQVKRSFSLLGSLFVLFWYSLFFVCVIRVFYFNQHLMLRFHQSAFGSIGDDAERIVMTSYVIYMMWKLPVSVSGGRQHIQAIIDADAAMKEMGISISYTRTARLAAMAVLLQIIAGGLHYISIWFSLTHHDSSREGLFPYSRIYQVVFFYAVAMVGATHYCSYLNVLRERFVKLNLRIRDVRDCKKSGNIYLEHFRLKKSKFIILLAANMRSCAKLYSTLTEGANNIDAKYGFMVVTTMIVTIFFFMLNVSYLIESHSNSISDQDQINYICFLNYVIWELVYSFTLVFICVYFCEWTKSEASNTANLVWEVINEDFDPAVTAVCMQFSLQLMHQRPTAVRFYRLNYQLLLKEVRTMAFFLAFMFQTLKKYEVVMGSDHVSNNTSIARKLEHYFQLGFQRLHDISLHKTD